MPSISHRTSLGQATPHRAESGSTALPAGFIRGFSRGFIGGIIGGIIRVVGAPVRRCAELLDDWRELRQLRDLDDHLLRDIGLTVAEARRSTIFHARRDRGTPDHNAPGRNAPDRTLQVADRDPQDPKGMPPWPTIS